MGTSPTHPFFGISLSKPSSYWGTLISGTPISVNLPSVYLTVRSGNHGPLKIHDEYGDFLSYKMVVFQFANRKITRGKISLHHQFHCINHIYIYMGQTTVFQCKYHLKHSFGRFYGGVSIYIKQILY